MKDEHEYPKQLLGKRSKELYDDIRNRYPDADEVVVISYTNTVEKMEELQTTIFNKPYYSKSGQVVANPNVKSLEIYIRLSLQLAKAIGIGKVVKEKAKKPTLLAFNNAR